MQLLFCFISLHFYNIVKRKRKNSSLEWCPFSQATLWSFTQTAAALIMGIKVLELASVCTGAATTLCKHAHTEWIYWNNLDIWLKNLHIHCFFLPCVFAHVQKRCRAAAGKTNQPARRDTGVYHHWRWNNVVFTPIFIFALHHNSVLLFCFTDGPQKMLSCP